MRKTKLVIGCLGIGLSVVVATVGAMEWQRPNSFAASFQATKPPPDGSTVVSFQATKPRPDGSTGWTLTISAKDWNDIQTVVASGRARASDVLLNLLNRSFRTEPQLLQQVCYLNGLFRDKDTGDVRVKGQCIKPIERLAPGSTVEGGNNLGRNGVGRGLEGDGREIPEL